MSGHFDSKRGIYVLDDPPYTKEDFSGLANNFFETQDLEGLGVTTWSKDELIRLIHALNHEMVNSSEYWEGG